MEGVNTVKGMRVLGIIEKQRVNGNEDLNSDVSGKDNNEWKMKESLAQVEEIPVTPVPEVTLATVENLTTNLKAQTKENTAKIRDSEPEAKVDLNADLELAAIERLAENERLAEKERQEKIRRREELDRMARLKRILALVRAPELDSVAKITQVGVERVEMTLGEKMTNRKESDVAAEINPVLKIRKTEEVKPLAEQKAVVEADMLVKKKRITEYEGIVKLERMSKSERISEIDRLVNLELEAEAKRSAKVKRVAELERLAELERVAKMKRLTEIDLKADMENVEKEHVAEEKRQEKIKRKEELERVARLQRVLANVLASESNQAVEAQAVHLERNKEKNRKDELKLLEELGIIPKEQMAKAESGKEVKPIEGEKLVATVASDADNIAVKVTELKDENVSSVKGFKPMPEATQLPEVKERFTDVDVETLASMEQPSEIESDATLLHVAIIEDKAKANQDIKIKRREELERVSNLERNPKLNRVADMKQSAGLEKTTELKRREETKILEELGIISTPQVVQIQGEEVNPVEVKHGAVLDKDANSMKYVMPMAEVKPGVKKDVELHKVGNVEHLKELQVDTVAEAKREANIKSVSGMQRKAKADHEARIKKREELVRVENLQRVVAMVDNGELDHVPKTKNEELERMAEKKRRDDMKVLEELGLVSKEQEVQQSVTKSKTVDKNNDFPMTPVEDANIDVDFKAATEVGPTQRQLSVKVDSSPDQVIGMEQMSENERMAVTRDVERRLTELRVAQMKRVAVMGREMKMNATMKQEYQREINHTIETESTKEATELKRLEELKPLEKSRFPDVRQDLGVQSKMKGVKELKSVAFLLPEKREGVEPVIGMGQIELKPAEPRRVEVKRETGFESGELKRLKEMKRVVGMEQVRGYDCEWDGQMMYVGKA